MGGITRTEQYYPTICKSKQSVLKKKTNRYGWFSFYDYGTKICASRAIAFLYGHSQYRSAASHQGSGGAFTVKVRAVNFLRIA